MIDIFAAVNAANWESCREARVYRWVALAMLLLSIAAGAAFALLASGPWLLAAFAVLAMATCLTAMIGFMW